MPSGSTLEALTRVIGREEALEVLVGYNLGNLVGAGTGVLTALTYAADAASGFTTTDGTATLTGKTLTNCLANTQTAADASTKIATTAYADQAAGYTKSAYAAGTAYSLTNTSAALAFGTTSPSVTLDRIGRWLIRGKVAVQDNGATFAASRTVTLKLRRSNNTPADVTNGSDTMITGIVTTLTAEVGDAIVEAEYTTAGITDAVTIFGDVSAAPSAGSIDCVAPGTWIRAQWLGAS